MRDQQEFFDTRAKTWEKTCYPPQTRKRLEQLVEEFSLCPGACVLDVGTGSGVLQPYVRQIIGPSGRIVAFDLSFNMIHEARTKELSSHDLFFQGNAQAMPLHANSFDHVICFAAFPHFPNALTALCELSRVAKPGAEVIIAHLLSREELAKHHGAHDAVADDVLPNDDEMRALFAQAGLHPPQITDCPGRYMARARKRP